MPFTRIVNEHIIDNAVELLHVLPEHLDNLTVLPFHHKDPFDRLIISQGQNGNIPILSKDELFDEYGIQRLW